MFAASLLSLALAATTASAASIGSRQEISATTCSDPSASTNVGAFKVSFANSTIGAPWHIAPNPDLTRHPLVVGPGNNFHTLSTYDSYPHDDFTLSMQGGVITATSTADSQAAQLGAKAPQSGETLTFVQAPGDAAFCAVTQNGVTELALNGQTDGVWFLCAETKDPASQRNLVFLPSWQTPNINPYDCWSVFLYVEPQ